MASKGIAYFVDGRKMPLPHMVDMNRVQTESQSFPLNVVCYVKRPFFEEIAYRVPGSSDFLSEAEYKHMAIKANNEEDEKTKSFLRSHEKVTV